MSIVPKLSVIACVIDRTGVFSVDDKLPGGGFKEDLESFKLITQGNNSRNAVVMGRNTFESLPKTFRGKGLPDRLNIVITTNPDKFADLNSENLMFCKNLHSAVSVASERCCEEIFFIGGKSIWLEALESFYITRAYITVVKMDISPDCKTQTIEELLPANLLSSLQQKAIQNKGAIHYSMANLGDGVVGVIRHNILIV